VNPSRRYEMGFLYLYYNGADRLSAVSGKIVFLLNYSLIYSLNIGIKIYFNFFLILAGNIDIM
jgi:hypothetical protein